MTRWVLLGLLLVAAAPVVAFADCPVGSYPWVDSWGNNICKSFGRGGSTTIEGSLDACPAGMYPWVDKWGTSICRFGGGGDAYDTSRGCPVGFHEWIDKWGNPVCRPLGR